MGLLDHLRERREMKRLGERLLGEMPRIESNGMGLSIDARNNYFVCAFLHHEIDIAVKRKWYDRLRVYDRYLDGRYNYEAVTAAVKALRSLTSDPVDTLISDNHVLTAQSLIDAFRKQGHFGPADIGSHCKEVLILCYRNPEVSGRITDIVADRDITNTEAIMELVERGAEMPEPFSGGAL